MKRSGETKDRTRLAFPMMVSSNVRRPFTGCRSLRTDAVRGKEIRYRLRAPWNHAGAVARDAHIHRVRPRTSVAGLAADDRGDPFAIDAHGRSCGAEKERLPRVS